MIIDFKARRTTLVASPVDGRSGIPTLTTLAESLLGIPITKGEDYVVFVSRSRKVCYQTDNREGILLERVLQNLSLPIQSATYELV